MTSKLPPAMHRGLARGAGAGRAPRPPTAATGKLTPVHVRVVTCCRGWYFKHSAECSTPHSARPCSDCYADPGGSHIYPCCSWFDVEPVESPDEAALWPDAARWPGHAIVE
ncbi:hypothetical protein GCM10010172_31410 [Paractinoplanes ferrugineus]|uniref:Uncharacterized protein n=1 Tax=Paractinoplanes ferrugineus TaxID=113564 RepID=A0A919J6D6_9ACTN|nr:hypothetical protein Afe05nite_60070 [Actinoplanes ferrugineus]